MVLLILPSAPTVVVAPSSANRHVLLGHDEALCTKLFPKGRLKPRTYPRDHLKASSHRAIHPSETFDVKKILAHRISTNGQHHYLVQWKHLQNNQVTWEPESHFNGQRPIQEFCEQQNSKKIIQ
jgi:hypothetical protein